MPILVPSSAKRIATQMLVIEELNRRKDFILRSFVCEIICPSKELPAQSKLLRQKNRVWKLLRITNEDIRTDITKIAEFGWKNADVSRTQGMCHVIYVFFESSLGKV